MSMSLLLGFVNNKVSLAYKTHKASKRSTRRGEEDRRAEASTSRRGWARPAQPHAEGVLTHSMRLEMRARIKSGSRDSPHVARLDVAWASRPLSRGHPARALAGAGRSRDSVRARSRPAMITTFSEGRRWTATGVLTSRRGPDEGSLPPLRPPFACHAQPRVGRLPASRAGDPAGGRRVHRGLPQSEPSSAIHVPNVVPKILALSTPLRARSKSQG